MNALFDLNRNYSIFALPAAAVVTLWPQTAGKAMALNNYDPALPRDFVESIKKSEKLDKVTKSRILRCEAATANGFEQLPLFIGAVLAANQAAVPARTLNLLVGGWLASRVVYNVTYVHLQDNRKFAPLRSIVFIGSIVCWATLYIKAGLAMLASSK